MCKQIMFVFLVIEKYLLGEVARGRWIGMLSMRGWDVVL
jgi:hypothetical protein